MGLRRVGFLAALFPSFVTCPIGQPKLDEIKAQVEANEALLIDVRSTQEWVDGHVAFALHIPVTELDAGHLPINLPRDKILYLYCQKGRRSKRAQRILKEDEYPCVVNLTYNIDDFRRAGYPVQ